MFLYPTNDAQNKPSVAQPEVEVPARFQVEAYEVAANQIAQVTSKPLKSPVKQVETKMFPGSRPVTQREESSTASAAARLYSTSEVPCAPCV